MSLNKTTKASLKTVAERVGLAPCSVSAVLNETPASRTIPQATKDRIFRAAAELNYRPNFWARSLRTKRTRMIAVVTPDFGRAAVARVVAAAQNRLHRAGYLLVLTASNTAETSHNPGYFEQRGIEGLIAIDATLPAEVDLAVASVDLSYLPSSELVGGGIQSWLLDLGISAAETVMREIETGKPARQISVEPKLPSGYFNLTGAGAKTYAGERETA